MKFFLKLAFFLALPLLGAQSVYSCGCIPQSFEDQFKHTKYVFVGKVIDISEDANYKNKPYESKRYLVRMNVLENFKGAKGKEIVINQYEIKEITSCPDFPLQSGETYLIYASATSYPISRRKIIHDIRHHEHCSPTQKFDPLSPAYKELVAMKNRQHRPRQTKLKKKQP